MLQCVAVSWSVLQRVALGCSVLHCAAVCCSVLQCAAVYCSALQCAGIHAVFICATQFTLLWDITHVFITHTHLSIARQCTAPHCNTLHHTATRYNATYMHDRRIYLWKSREGFLTENRMESQCVAVCCSVLQCEWKIRCVPQNLRYSPENHCKTLYYDALHCTTLHYAPHCTTLHHIAPPCKHTALQGEINWKTTYGKTKKPVGWRSGSSNMNLTE